MKRSLVVLVTAVLLLTACSHTVPVSVSRPIPTYWPASMLMRLLCEGVALQAAGYVSPFSAYGLRPGEIRLLPALKAPGSISSIPEETKAKVVAAYQALCEPSFG